MESKNGFREQNNNWRGGRSLASNGYILIRVGVGHHLADVRGYAYEHRIVAETKLGRKLLPDEIVHHKNENKQDNRPDNLEVVKGNAEHFVFHRRPGSQLRLPGEPNPLIDCECGCGARFENFDSSGRPRRFVSGHNPRNDGLAGIILWYLANVPESGASHFMAGMMEVPTRRVSCAASKLKRRGLVELHNGEWRLTG
jgi:hypothetical protein